MLVPALGKGAPADLQHEVQGHACPILDPHRGVERQNLLDCMIDVSLGSHRSRSRCCDLAHESYTDGQRTMPVSSIIIDTHEGHASLTQQHDMA